MAEACSPLYERDQVNARRKSKSRAENQARGSQEALAISTAGRRRAGATALSSGRSTMAKRLLAACFVSLPFWAFLSPARATTVAPPPNLGALARASQSVTFAEAVESWGEDGETIPVTVTRFHLLQPVAGARTSDVFEVVEPGGQGEEGAAAGAVGSAVRADRGRSAPRRWLARRGSTRATPTSSSSTALPATAGGPR